MLGEQILLDPTAEGTGTQLDITDSSLGYYLLEHDYPDPDIDVVYAGSIDTEGKLPAASTPGNRTITATIRCLQPAGGTPSIGTIVKGLQLKVGKMRREGGTYRRVLPSGDTITFDVLKNGAHRIKVPSDKRWLTRQAADVTMSFECAPLGRGTEIDLGDNVETTLPVLVFTDTGVKGDVEGLGRLMVDLDSAPARRGVFMWGIESRYYNSASTAALFYEAETLTASAAAANAGAAGASGGGANKVMRQTNVGPVPEVGFTSPTGASRWTHIGIFTVLARVFAPNTNTGTVSVRLEYEPSFGAGSIANDEVPIVDVAGAPIENAWVWVNLGQVTLSQPITGDNGWIARFAANGNTTDQLDWDCVALIPVSEGSGNFTDISGIGITSDNQVQLRHDACLMLSVSGGGGIWRRPIAYEGDYLKIPPAGLEARTMRVIVLITGTPINPPFPQRVFTSPSIDDISAQLFYTPRYLVVPEP
jgi:hypothetical protein